MSKTIDERVVEMRFDNKQFESNVQTSLSTIEKLKKSLDMDGATKGLESIDSAAKKVDMSGLGSAVETVKTRFSALEIMAVTALANITNSVVNTGKQMLHSLTIEPISQGFEEYELKMGSIQTIMMSTGASLEEVNKYLQELNTYSDKTIYSFQDMTSNIGKFTNAGVGLEDAVMAIQGVSNVAAVSGANANEASRAMYNFAQALSAGYVKLIDWKSIENANMATVEFKTQLLESAVACGTLTKTADGMYKTVKGIFRRADHSRRDQEQAQLMRLVQQAFDDSAQRFGAEKIRITLAESGVRVSTKRIAAIMQELDLHSIRPDAKKQYKKHQQYKKQNLLNQQFTADRPNQIWVSDITYFKINDYWVYFCVILDLFSRKVVGYRVSRNASTNLVTSTFRSAFRERGDPSGLTFHSDRGKQYTSAAFAYV